MIVAKFSLGARREMTGDRERLHQTIHTAGCTVVSLPKYIHKGSASTELTHYARNTYYSTESSMMALGFWYRHPMKCTTVDSVDSVDPA